jgi:hypothetical protein
MRQLLVGIVAQTSCLQARMPALPHPSLTHYMLVRLKRKSSRYPDLTPRHDYVVIGIEAGDYRIKIDSRLAA